MTTYHPQSRISLFLCLLLALPAALPLRAQQEEDIPAEAAPGIAIVPQDSFNIEINEFITPTYITVKVSPPTHGWFAGSFINLPIGTPVTLGFSMSGIADGTIDADVKKWRGLRPVMTYADPTSYSSYEWFTRDDQGRWVSGDPLKADEARFAGTGEVPDQNMVPAEVAEQFLSADRCYWQPWQDITDIEVLENVNIFRLRASFALPATTVAMRVPYTYTYHQALLRKIEDAQLSGVTIDIAGKSREGRELSVIRLESLDAPEKSGRPTILAYAREHATEPDTSWVVAGMLHWLISADPAARAARRQYNWLLIPLLDPDRAVHSVYSDGCNFLTTGNPGPEVLEYARYCAKWVDTGHRIEAAVNLHNVECADGQHVFVPLVNNERKPAIASCNTALFQTLGQHQFFTGKLDWCPTGYPYARFAGWCWRCFGTFDLAYEVNSRYPADPLSMARLDELGGLLAAHLAAWLNTREFAPIRAQIDNRLADRQHQREARLARSYGTPERKKIYSLLMYGYPWDKETPR